jgi:all-trans-retinol 13,14-reductase
MAFDHLTDGALQWSPMPDVYDRFDIGGRLYEFPTGVERFQAQLIAYFPADAVAIRGYVAAVNTARKSSGLYFAEKAMPGPVARVVGGLMRAPFLRWAGRTTLDVMQGLTKNQELIGLLTGQWGNYGLPPAQSSFGIHAVVAGHYFNGASYPVGGASRIYDTIRPVIERSGGRVVVGAEVTALLMDKQKAIGVRMADGREFRADAVISDAGARNTFERLVPGPRAITEALSRMPQSMAHLSLYVGLKHTAAELGLSGTNLWVHPTPDHDANLDRFTNDPAAPFPLLFFSFPSAKDPEFTSRHPGHATIEVVTIVPYAPFERWEDSRWRHREPDYDAFKASLASRLQAELERHVPAVAGRIDHAELSTPLSTRHFMNYARGEVYGVAATPARFRSRVLGPRTPITNLYLSGQDVSSLGVTGAMFGGALAASAVLGRNMVSRMTKS